MPRCIRTRDLNRRAATLTDIVFYLVWQPLIVQDCLWTSDQPDIVFYLEWQPLVGQDPSFTHDSSGRVINSRTDTTIPRWNSNTRSQQASGPSERHCILFGVTAPNRSRLPLEEWLSRNCILFGVTATCDSGSPH